MQDQHQIASASASHTSDCVLCKCLTYHADLSACHDNANWADKGDDDIIQFISTCNPTLPLLSSEQVLLEQCLSSQSQNPFALVYPQLEHHRRSQEHRLQQQHHAHNPLATSLLSTSCSHESTHEPFLAGGSPPPSFTPPPSVPTSASCFFATEPIYGSSPCNPCSPVHNHVPQPLPPQPYASTVADSNASVLSYPTTPSPPPSSIYQRHHSYTPFHLDNTVQEVPIVGEYYEQLSPPFQTCTSDEHDCTGLSPVSRASLSTSLSFSSKSNSSSPLGCMHARTISPIYSSDSEPASPQFHQTVAPIIDSSLEHRLSSNATSASALFSSKSATTTSRMTTSRALVRKSRGRKAPRTHVCDICSKRFSCSSNMTRHRRVHTGERPFDCHFCTMTFVNSSNRNKHERICPAGRSLIYNSIPSASTPRAPAHPAASTVVSPLPLRRKLSRARGKRGGQLKEESV